MENIDAYLDDDEKEVKKMIRSRDELMKWVVEKIGDDTSDEALAIIEDFTDTFNNYDDLVKDTSDWKQKYNELDETWRKRYKERFFSGTSPDDVIEKQKEDVIDDAENRTYDDLFEEREG